MRSIRAMSAIVLLCLIVARLQSSDLIDTWLISGQSNAVGYATGEPHPGSSHVLMLDTSHHWIEAKEPFAFLGSTGIGPWHSAALKAIEQANLSIHLIGSAHGGQPIAMWDAGAGFFTDIVENIKAADEVPGLFLWYQGEADALTPITIEAYRDKLCDLIARVRIAAKNPDMTAVIIQLAYFNYNKDVPGAVRIREAQRQAVLSDSNALLVSALGCACDGVHLTRDGYFALGERIARALLKSRYGQKKTVWPGPVLDAAVLTAPDTVAAHFIEVTAIKGCAPTDFMVQDSHGLVLCKKVVVSNALVDITCERPLVLPAQLIVGYGGVPSYQLADEVGNVAPSIIMDIASHPLPQVTGLGAPSGAGAIKVSGRRKSVGRD